MGNWGIIVPTAATNYIHNPSFHFGTDDWSDYTTETATGVRTWTVAYALQGYHSYLIAKGSAADTGDYGTAHTVAGFADFDSGDVLALSAFVYVASSSTMTLEAEVTNAGGSETFSVSQAGEYTGRISVTGTLTADATAITVRAYIPDDNEGGFYITGVQLEKTQLTTYFDGFTPGCSWVGEWSSSNSTRPVTARKGGIETEFDSYSFYITGTTGLASAEIGNEMQERTTQPGGYVRDSRTPSRQSSLIGELIGTSLSNLHSIRNTLLTLLSAAGDDREFTIWYDGSGTRLYLDAILDGGFGSFGRKGFTERIAIRLISESPYWYRGYKSSAALDGFNRTTNFYLLGLYKEGAWSLVGSVTGAPDVHAIVEKNGKLYVGGSFSVVDSVTDTDNFAIYDGESWTTLGTGVNGTVRAIAVHDNGDIFVGGDFADCGGVANTQYLGKWDASAGAWVSMSATIDGAVYALKIGKALSGAAANWLYIGGAHATPHYLAYAVLPVATSIAALGTGIASTVRALDIQRGNLFIGGSFANISTDTDMSYIAEFDGTTFTALGTGMDAAVYSVLCHSDGSVYAGGAFTTASGTAMARVAQWTGTAWSKVGPSDFTLDSGTVYRVTELIDRTVAIAGAFTTDWGQRYPPDEVILWSGDTYYTHQGYASDAYFYLESNQYGQILAMGLNDWRLGHNTTVTYSGSVPVSPIFRIQSSLTSFVFGGPPISIHNARNNTAQRYLRYIETAEELLIGPIDGEFKAISTSLGERALTNLLGNSDFLNFQLLPGSNVVNAYQGDSISMTPTISLHWTDRFWSRDGA